MATSRTVWVFCPRCQCGADVVVHEGPAEQDVEIRHDCPGLTDQDRDAMEDDALDQLEASGAW